ncbi:short chain dehydrogenase [Gracilaria domingensis]|nr:short chain dehydrogenase [Gracilaria domingensis]
MSLNQRTVVITGATRGIGRGLAIGVGEAGGHVIITGRTKSGPLSLEATAQCVREAGGTCDFHVVDHGDDGAVSSFFATLKQSLHEQNRTLDVFVNNAYSGVGFLTQSIDIPYWLKSASRPNVEDRESAPGEIWDLINGVGLRTIYVCAIYAARIMANQPKGGLIVNISSWGGLVSIFDPVYGIGKSGVDRLSAELAQGAPPDVQCFTLYPGTVATEAMREAVKTFEAAGNNEKAKSTTQPDVSMWNAETPLFVGRVLAAIVASDKKMFDSMNGRIVIAAEAAQSLKISDEYGFRPLSLRSFRFALLKALPGLRKSSVRHLIPASLCVPWWLVQMLAGAVRVWK